MRGPTRARQRSATFDELMSAATAGEPWAIDAVADQYLGRLTSFAAGRGAADPDGIANLVLLSVLNRLDELHFEAPERFWAYLCRATRYRVIDEYRASKPVDLIESQSALEAQHFSLDEIMFDDHIAEREYVDKLLSPLTDEQRQVLELRFFDDLSIEETASRTGRSRTAVKGLQRRAINAILAAVAIALLVLVTRGFGDSQAVRQVDDDPASENPVTEDRTPEETALEGTVPEDDVTDGTVPNQAVINEPGADEPVTIETGTGETGTGETGTGETGTGETGTGETGTDETSTGETGTDESGTSEPITNEKGADETGPDEPVTSETVPDETVASETGTDQTPPTTATPEEAASEGTGTFSFTVGTNRATELNTAGAPTSVSAHGVRIYCPVSHVSHDDPIRQPGQPRAATAQLYWGNTSADAFTDGPAVAESGNGTCEGGINDRSAYWMPALFDADDQVVIPESVRVEYKSFGGPGFDRSTIQPIPTGLELVADSRVARSSGRLGGLGRSSEGGVSVSIQFPTCVAIAQSGAPLLSSSDGSSHLSYPNNGSGAANGCPVSHPYRIPQLSYSLEYDVAFGSKWYLSSDGGSSGATRTATGGAIYGMRAVAAEAVARCNRELLSRCDFLGTDAAGRTLNRDQLPERFVGPDGQQIYSFSLSLVDDADRTPFGTTVTPLP